MFNRSVFKNRHLLLIAMGIFLFSSNSFANGISFKKSERRFLIQEFSNKNFDHIFLKKTFNHPKLKKVPLVVKKNIVNIDPVDHYKDFLAPYSIFLGSRFLKRWRTLLKKASLKYQVDKELIVAVLLVETGLGNVMGKYHVISVFSSIVVEYEHQKKAMAINPNPSDRQIYELKRLNKKDIWARQQLFALLKIIKHYKQSPFYYKGSYAGAFGIPQFLPTSYLKWGVDSDDNGSVNLYWYPDAIFSVANYLKEHGWRPGLDRKAQEKVIWEYNHSRTYVATILAASKKLKHQNRKITKK